MTGSRSKKTRARSDVYRLPVYRMLRNLRCGHLGLLLLITVFFVPVMGQGGDTSPGDAFKGYQVKAVFLYNLINFVTWPDSAFKDSDSPFVISVLGKDPFGGALEKVIEGEQIQGRRLVLERITGLKDLGFCHILFISPSINKDLVNILKTTSHEPVLTVGDVEDFTQEGGIVGLIPKKGRISVEINTDMAKEAGLVISAKLLNLATIVKRHPATKKD